MKLPAIIFLSLISACAAPEAEFVPEPASSVYWSDGDSGQIDGMKFRLSDVDAPETGGVGSFGGAKCESERALGYEAKEFIVELTKNADLEITARYGPDRYEREVIDLSANGKDVGAAAIDAGHLGPWPHNGRRALTEKPDWCAPSN